MATSARPVPRRGPSGAWSRLRPPPVDPLEAYGLPSKGETRLSDFRAQETYFETIVARYMKFCASCGSGEKLEQAFATLHLDPATAPNSSASIPSRTPLSGQVPQTATTTPRPCTPAANAATAASLQGTANPQAPQPPALATHELPAILLAMRKLREAIVSTSRRDAFAQRAYVFIVRTTLHPFGHLESYHPSLLHLLNAIHPCTPLTPSELQEFGGYLVLDLACRSGDFSEAYRVKRKLGIKDWKVERVVKALVTDDWVLFWRVRRQVDAAQRTLLAWAEEGVRRHALKCLARTYLSVDCAFLERCTGASWARLVDKEKVAWVLDGNGTVTIRRPKAK